MLRPSRPMMRPFISSPGRCSTDTTDSLVCSLATRWMASVTIFRARCLPSFCASFSISLTMTAASRLAWFSMVATSSALAWSAVSPATRSSTSRRSSHRAGPARRAGCPAPARPGPGAADRCPSFCSSESSRLLPLGQPVLPALQVVAQLARLVLGGPESSSASARAFRGLLGRLLGAADDPRGVGFSGRPPLAARLASSSRCRASVARAASPGGCCPPGATSGAAVRAGPPSASAGGTAAGRGAADRRMTMPANRLRRARRQARSPRPQCDGRCSSRTPILPAGPYRHTCARVSLRRGVTRAVASAAIVRASR